MDFVLVIVALGVGLASLEQARRDPRITPEFWWKSLRVLGGYAVFIAAGLFITVRLMPRVEGSQAGALTLTLFMLSWVALGALWLMRLAPRLKEPPEFLMRPWGALDWALIALSVSSALAVML